MSKLDYLFKEISVDPFFLESMLPAPDYRQAAADEASKEKRAAYVRARMKDVRKAMNQHLTGRQKECLTLHYLHGYYQHQIGELLQIHQTTVSQHILSGLKKLKYIFNSGEF